MAKPSTLQEKKEYQRPVYFDMDRLLYIGPDVDPYAYLENYPNSRLVEVLTVTDNTVISGAGMDPAEVDVLAKKGGQVYKLKVSSDKKRVEIVDEGNVIVGGQKPVISQALTGGTGQYVYTQSTSYTTVAEFNFAGTDVLGVPTELQCVVEYTQSSGNGAAVRFYDQTNAEVIAEIQLSSNSKQTLVFSQLDNLSPSLATWEIHAKRGDKNGQMRVYSYSIIF